MKITLNRANKLRNSLESLNIPFVEIISLRTDSELSDSTKQYEISVHNLLSAYKELQFKADYVKKLRSLISIANHENKINDIIAEIAMIENLIKILSSKSPSSPYGTRTVGLDDFIGAIKHRDAVIEKTDSIPNPERLIISLEDESVLNYKKKLLSDLKLESSKLQESRNELNHKVLIELPEDIVEFLKKYSII